MNFTTEVLLSPVELKKRRNPRTLGRVLRGITYVLAAHQLDPRDRRNAIK